MSLEPGLVGRTFPATAPYTVSQEKIDEFVVATGSRRSGSDAPPTFPIVLAFQALTAFLADDSTRIDLRNVVHADQRFEQARPLRAGDTLIATLTVDSLRSLAGADMIGTRTEIATAAGDVVVTGYATLVHRTVP